MQDDVMIVENAIVEKKKKKRATAALIWGLISLLITLGAGLVFLAFQAVLPVLAVSLFVTATIILFIIPVIGWIILGIAVYFVPPLVYQAVMVYTVVSILIKLLLLPILLAAGIAAILSIVTGARSSRKGVLILPILSLILGFGLIFVILAGIVTDILFMIIYAILHNKLIMPTLLSQFA